MTVAVSVAADARDQVGVAPVRETAEPRPVEEWTERFRAGASQLFDRESVRALLGRLGGGAGAGVPSGGASTGPSAGSERQPQRQPRVEGGRTGDGDGVADPFGALPAGLGKLDMMNQSLDTMQSILTRYRLAGYPRRADQRAPRRMPQPRVPPCGRDDHPRSHARRQALDGAGLVSGGPVPDAPRAAQEQPVLAVPGWRDRAAP